MAKDRSLLDALAGMAAALKEQSDVARKAAADIQPIIDTLTERQADLPGLDVEKPITPAVLLGMRVEMLLKDAVMRQMHYQTLCRSDENQVIYIEQISSLVERVEALEARAARTDWPPARG